MGKSSRRKRALKEKRALKCRIVKLFEIREIRRKSQSPPAREQVLKFRREKHVWSQEDGEEGVRLLGKQQCTSPGESD